MANKTKKEIELAVHGEAEREVKAFDKFFRLSSLLFDEDNENCPYRMNELKEDNVFYKEAKALAEELEIDWDKMTDEESNRIMVNLLGDSYMAIKPEDIGTGIVVTTSVEIKAVPKEKGGDANVSGGK